MQEGWGTDSYYGFPHNFCFPFCVNDDGTALTVEETRKRYSNTYNFMYDNDSRSYGEKPVSHIKVTSNLLNAPGQTTMCNGLPTTCVYTVWGYGNWHWTHHIETYMNGYHERVYKHYGETPQITDVWYDVTYTQVEMRFPYLSFFGGKAYCSEAYGERYGYDPSGYDPGTRQAYVDQVFDKPYFSTAALSANEAMRYYELLRPKHTPPDGIFSELWRKAMNSISFNTNSIANGLELIKFINDIKSGRIFKSLADLRTKTAAELASSAWMGYRYSYSTTKSDIEEYTSKARELVNYDYARQHIVRSGMSTDTGVYHCKVTYHDKRQNDACELYKQLKRTGSAVDLYNVWDMIPMSFVVDWFLPIGDYLEDLSSNWVSTPGYFTIDSIVMSSKWSDTLVSPNGQVTVSAYTRNVSTNPPPFESYSEDPTTGTVIKRVIDGVCLLIG